MSWNFSHDCSSTETALEVEPDESGTNTILFRIYYEHAYLGTVHESIYVPLAEAKNLAQQILDTEEVVQYPGLDEATCVKLHRHDGNTITVVRKGDAWLTTGGTLLANSTEALKSWYSPEDITIVF